MEKELQTKLAEILGSIQTAAGTASDFALSQLPDIAQSYVMYGRTVAVIKGLTLLILAVGLAKLAWFAYTKAWYTTIYGGKARTEGNYCVLVLSAVLAVVSATAAIATFDYLVWLAPKVWLLKQIGTMLK